MGPARNLLAVWLATLAGAAGVLVLLAIAGWRHDFQTQRFADPAHTVFIGTSALRHALPLEAPLTAPSIVPDPEARLDQRMLRVTGANLRPADAARLARMALDAGARRLVLDARTFTVQARVDETSAKWLLRQGDWLRQALRAGYLGGESGLVDTNRRDLTREVMAAEFTGFSGEVPPPPRLRTGPDAALVALAEEARARGVALWLIETPRSASWADRLGPAHEAAWRELVTGIQRATGLSVWRPAAAWPDAYFLDKGHLNAAGRARFTAALKTHLDG